MKVSRLIPWRRSRSGHTRQEPYTLGTVLGPKPADEPEIDVDGVGAFEGEVVSSASSTGKYSSVRTVPLHEGPRLFRLSRIDPV
jgi:hypothetical protein